MCGIWAYVNGTTAPTEEESRANYTEFMNLKPRGPDHTRWEAYPTFTLGFHRLAIVDSSFSSHQPFIKEDALGKVILLCNGEIYNYREMAQTYFLHPITNDCHMLLELYWFLMKAGMENQFPSIASKTLKGEYAFVFLVLDELGNLRRVVAGRDAVGVRPLYLSDTPRGLLFTSEIKGARSHPLQEFPPGNIIGYEKTLQGAWQEKYCSPHPSFYHTDTAATSPSSALTSEKQHLSAVQSAVVASVQRRLHADPPLAFLLSGGIDSSLVAAVSAKLLGRPLRTFCCSLQEDGKAVGRDVEFAREVAQHIGAQHTEVLFTKEEALAAIPDVIRTIESWDTTTVRASVGQYLVSRWIGRNTDCRVLLVGEGPDEVCSSYLFNWYAPSPEALHTSAKDYIKNIHLYDGRRADRCIARWGLEARVPLLDPEFITAYWMIPAEQRMPKTKGIEKWWLREAFKDTGLLPERVRLRMKDAFSDSISGQVSWTQIIQQWVEDKVTDEDMANAAATYPHCPPQTKEAYYYRRIFCEAVGEHHQTILPGYWQPRWNAEGKEIHGYVDPSARTLGVYHTRETSTAL